MVYQLQNLRRFAAMGGTYGNVPALKACLQDARNQQCEALAFLGDAIGYCGHSDEIVDLIRDHFDILVVGNYEQQAAAGLTTCGCGYASEEDERIGGMIFERAVAGLSASNRQRLGTWPDTKVIISAATYALAHKVSLLNRMLSFVFFTIAALGEIAGCYAFWAWLRLGKSIFWLIPGIICLIIFASILTRVDASNAGRVYAAYGGIYVLSSLFWLWLVEGVKPDKWDLLGVTICLSGTLVILFGPHENGR